MLQFDNQNRIWNRSRAKKSRPVLTPPEIMTFSGRMKPENFAFITIEENVFDEENLSKNIDEDKEIEAVVLKLECNPIIYQRIIFKYVYYFNHILTVLDTHIFLELIDTGMMIIFDSVDIFYRCMDFLTKICSENLSHSGPAKNYLLERINEDKFTSELFYFNFQLIGDNFEGILNKIAKFFSIFPDGIHFQQHPYELGIIFEKWTTFKNLFDIILLLLDQISIKPKRRNR
jgi:hypothetical protein